MKNIPSPDSTTLSDVKTKIIPIFSPDELEPLHRHLYRTHPENTLFKPWQNCSHCKRPLGTTALDIVRPAAAVQVVMEGTIYVHTICNLGLPNPEDQFSEDNLEVVQGLLQQMLPGTKAKSTGAGELEEGDLVKGTVQ